jgi:hypothetical protein
MNVLVAHNSLSDVLGSLRQTDLTIHEISLSELSKFSSSFVYDEIFIEAGAELFSLLNAPQITEEIKARIIAVGIIDEVLSDELKQLGQLRFIERNRFEQYLRYLKIGNHEAGGLSLLVFDESRKNIETIKQITKDFGHNITIVYSFDEFYSKLSDYYDFIFFNVHAETCDLPNMIRRVFSISNFKRAAVVPYLIEEHCKISDLFSGLNRIARAVLHYDELLQFLINYYYKRELKKYSNCC